MKYDLYGLYIPKKAIKRRRFILLPSTPMNNIESNEYSSLSLTPPAEAHKIIDQIKQEIIILKTTKDVSKLPIETIMRAKAFVTAKISYELRSIIRPTFSFER